MQRVLVVDATGKSLMPCRPARARLLCKQGKAVVRLRYPYTIMLHEARPEAVVEPLRLKLDPGAKTTGLAVVNDGRGEVVWAAELAHRGELVKHRLDQRRRSRRQRKTRYRKPRWHNRRRKPGWLPPSLLSRIANILTRVRRLGHWCPVGTLSLERVKFDTARLSDPTLVGAAYQQGTREGMEIREYLLYKWQRRCAYCRKPAERLEVEHLVPGSRGGSDRISNLVLACHACNQAKGDQTAEEFGHGHLLAQAKAPRKRCRRRERDPPGALRAVAGVRAAAGDGDGWADKMESRPARRPENATFWMRPVSGARPRPDSGGRRWRRC